MKLNESRSASLKVARTVHCIVQSVTLSAVLCCLKFCVKRSVTCSDIARERVGGVNTGESLCGKLNKEEAVRNLLKEIYNRGFPCFS
jgi:hypothetical protein